MIFVSPNQQCQSAYLSTNLKMNTFFIANCLAIFSPYPFVNMSPKQHSCSRLKWLFRFWQYITISYWHHRTDVKGVITFPQLADLQRWGQHVFLAGWGYEFNSVLHLYSRKTTEQYSRFVELNSTLFAAALSQWTTHFKQLHSHSYVSIF